MKPITACRLIRLFAIIVSVSLPGCTKNDPPPSPPSSGKIITSFVFKTADNPGLTTEVSGIIGQDTIKCTLPAGTVLTNLAPVIEFNGKSISPANKVAQNFTNAVPYIVTAEDGTTKTYVVIAKPLPSTAKLIKSFILKVTDNPALTSDISGTITTDSIKLTVPFGTNITALVPFITIEGTGVFPASLTAQNFTNTVVYTVTAEDASTKTYKVVVTAEPMPATLFIGSENVSNTGNLYALDVNTGIMRWKYTVPHGSFISSAEFVTGVLYSAVDSDLVAIDTMTRNIKWRYHTDNIIESTPTVVNGVVYVNSDDMYLYAVDAATGTLKWRFAQTPMSPLGGGNYSSPTVVNGVVYFGSIDNYIYAVNATTGTQVWRTENTYSPGTIFQSSPCVANGVLYIGDAFHYLLALNTSDGSFKWDHQVSGLIFASPTVVNGVVYITTSMNYLYAIDALTGVQKWLFPSAKQVYGSPIVVDDVVYFGGWGANSNGFYAVNASTGTLKWVYTHTGGFFSSPVIFNGDVYVGSDDGVLAINGSTGTKKWQFWPAGESYLASPVIVDKQGNVYYSSISGSKN